MRVMALIEATKESEAGIMPSTELMRPWNVTTQSW